VPHLQHFHNNDKVCLRCSLHPFSDKSPLDFLKAFSTSCKVQNSLSVNKQSFQQIPKTIFTADSWKQSFTVDFWNNLLQQISENSLITFISWTFFSLISYELIGLPKLLL
jgi:hypothetical protein